ncbi:MAG: thioredoxin family protein [Gracilimonas sp.]|uniref:thioredoxin family protein n=1 Tax=Gracilimonas TaxID=649462 RepID=UPI001B039646|nr:thioredoxin family protein [Gracilimonas sp.]MBO6586977.1 thioredoxin family protein [Gracilimonas sp.]MBO6614535.1 thioredoxin family protein [Gracilimonas sp.]
METAVDSVITRKLIENTISFEEYTDLVQQLFKEDRTTNEDNRPDMLEYTKLNIHRTSKWNKRAKISEELAHELKNFPNRMTWLVITEGWCGDAAQSLPFIHKMAGLSDNIELKLILRDQYPEVMDEFLTNGSRSIPKLIALDRETLEVLGTWGPRPKEIQEVYMSERANPEIENKVASENLHLWYARNKGKAMQEEFIQLLDEWKKNEHKTGNR